ncbi:Metallo-peptidase family M12-domain-containing protein [Fusarium tricinctum]|uniref:Disintegrin and metalloproteinase domain-containing protein B n=1 Tax=Fusarium tricinctum TaxID=61284 RepID=A0A8K0RZ19_9HYPO|nr:Metallo-peptidase family M12-domain-containing protein [Fusarium tricinctum]
MSLLTVFFLLLQVFSSCTVQAISLIRDTIDQSSTIETLEFSQDPHTITGASSFQVEFEVPHENQRITLNLQPSRNVLSRLTTVEHIKSSPNNEPIADLRSRPPLLYRGVAFVNDVEKETQRRVGWARVMVRYREGRHIIEGTFTNDGAYNHISLDSNHGQTRQQGSERQEGPQKMVVWKESHDDSQGIIAQRSSPQTSTCEAQRFDDRRRHEVEFGGEERYESHSRMLGHTRRQTPNDWFDPADYIGSTDGCPSSRRVALIGIAADCSYTAEFNSMQDARDNIISQVNVASQLYEDTFNIALAIQNLTISDPSCPSTAPSSMPWNLGCTANVDISERLNLFTRWRSRLRDNNAVWSLFTACRSGNTVGIAWIGSLCNRSRGSSWRGGGVGSANVVVRTAAEWQVFAHELAHNFGAAHDCTSSDCGSTGYSRSDNCCPLSQSTCDARNQYLMNPQSSPGLEEFSPCTIGTICTGIGQDQIDTSCLVSEDEVPDVNDSECGNGIVEPGEMCDCGGENGCPTDSCCNPSTCQLRSGAECDPATDGCCTDECRVAQSGLVCRESTADCDPKETCDGSSSQCPIDEQNCDEDEDSGTNGSGGSWVDNNRTAIIATSASVGGFVILLAFCLVCSCIRKRRRRQKGTQLQSGSFSDGSNAPALEHTGGVTQMPSAPPLVHRYA